MARSGMDADPIDSHFGKERGQQGFELLLEGLVEVEVNKRVVDVGTFGKEGGENKALGSHVVVLLVEYEEEGHNGIRRPGDDKAQTYAEKHLGEEMEKRK